MTLDEARDNVGAAVIYRPGHGEAEEGVISSVGARFVFVRYRYQLHGESGIATPPEQLTLLGGV